MTKPISLAALWHSYSTHVMPANAGPVQVTEMRRAFYAGCVGVLVMMHDDVAALDEDEAMQALDGLHAECAAFHVAVQVGKA